MVAKLTEAIREQVSSLPRWSTSGEETHQKLRSEAISARASRYKQPKKSALRNAESTSRPQPGHDQDPFVDEYAQEYATRLAEMEEEQWESLSFPVMYDREGQIATADLRTFDWIFEEPRREDRSWSNFLEWLEKGRGMYWINGKAGSGKSTLMKYLNENKKTIDALQSWSGETSLITASFFFWYDGNDLQKSQVGLLRALLYQGLTNHRELIPLVLSEAATVAPTDLPYYWTLSRLKSAFTKFLEQKEIALKIFLLVDGLDEYAGDHSEISELFRYVSNFEHIKLCVSSRPLLEFHRNFQDFPGLVLQNLTFDDIHTYVQIRFSAHERFKELEIEEPGAGSELASEVVNKASGVFLWVKLVVHSLLQGLGNYDRSIDLERRLNELPEDLDDLYWHILDRVKPAWYLEEGFKLLLLVHAAVVPLNLLQLAFADTVNTNLATQFQINEMTLKNQEALCRGMSGRIKSRCLGLLEVVDMGYKDEKYRRVQFLHKSVKDFIDTRRMKTRIQECLAGKDTDIPEVTIMKALLIQLKTVRSRLTTEQFCPGGGMRRESWFDEVRPVIFEIVRYGHIIASRHPGSSQVYGPLITEVDGIASELWHSVSFKALEEIGGKVHWSIAPRKPGNTTIRDEEEDEVEYYSRIRDARLKELPNAEDTKVVMQNGPFRANGDAGESDTIQPRVSDVSSDVLSDISSAPINSRFSFRSDVTSRRIRFEGLPSPQCFPGEDDKMERPERPWPCGASSHSPFRLSMARFSQSSCGFEAFVRALGLDEYADGRFEHAINLDKINNQTGVHKKPTPKRKSFWRRVRWVKKLLR
ncbi:hypothetical protein EG329_005864 [Mollisiaceae sp. DMI_Dod_QoI]|nr:hypothetical protein EG329_005864 [Helotiales sp. DMI_Dod_QoI]